MNDTWKKRPPTEIAARIAEIRASLPDAFLIAIIHWGDEYLLVPNDRQRAVARSLAGGGADLIIGHHPHVMQSVELIKNVPVFYSLGNFIFDQYFSAEVQKELLLRIALGDGVATYDLVPLVSERSRPRPADEGERDRILGALAERSGEDLRGGVRAGRFTVRY